MGESNPRPIADPLILPSAVYECTALHLGVDSPPDGPGLIEVARSRPHQHGRHLVAPLDDADTGAS